MSPFQPGQFNMLYAFGVGEAPISISGEPARSDHMVHTIRAVGTVTRALKALKPGATLGVRGPYGTPWPLDKAKGNDVLIIAGGVGLAPLRSAIYRILEERARYGQVAILYGARTPEDILFRKELEKWRGRFDLNVEVTVDTAPQGWAGNVGVVTQLIPQVPFDPISTMACVCGPEIMMRFTAQALLDQGLSDDNIYLTLERNMRCAIGFCGHCQFGPEFICKDGPVFPYRRIRPIFGKREI